MGRFPGIVKREADEGIRKGDGRSGKKEDI
jgi:hypothetical protein